jgi:hypothetical protein
MDAFDPTTQIANADAVTAVFGKWPSFHDAEILSMRLQRGPGMPTLACSIHVFEMTSAVDTHGHYVLKNHYVVTLSFSGLVLHEIKWFNHQNAIDDLEIGFASEGERRFSVYFPSNSGCEARFDCDAIAVTSVEASIPEGVYSDRAITLRPARPV